MEANPTVVFPEPGRVVVEDRAKPAPGPGDLLIRTRCTLISTGTELTVYSGDFPPDSGWSYYTYPSVPGYDNVGEVVEVGEGVDPNWVGRRVATYAAHAQYVTWPANDARRVHRDLPDDHASFFTIAEIVMNGVRRGNVQWGESVVVYGLGLLGQLTVRFCRFAGARPVIAVDVAEGRLRCLPSDRNVIPVNASRQEVASVVQEATRGRKADVGFEVTGNPEAIPQQIPLLRELGRLVILSSPRGRTREFDFHDLCNGPSVSIIGAHNFSHPPVASGLNPWTQHRHAELFFDLVADGELAMEPLITHRENYREAPRLYEMLLRDRSQAMGVILQWPEKAAA